MHKVSEACASHNCGCETAVVKLDLPRRSFLVAAGAFAAGLSTGSSMAASSKDSYAALLKSDPSLRGYWRFDDELVDVMGKAPAKASGSVSYVDGAVDGKAVSLEPNEPLAVAAPHHARPLDLAGGIDVATDHAPRLDHPPEGPVRVETFDAAVLPGAVEPVEIPPRNAVHGGDDGGMRPEQRLHRPGDGSHRRRLDRDEDDILRTRFLGYAGRARLHTDLPVPGPPRAPALRRSPPPGACRRVRGRGWGFPRRPPASWPVSRW